MKIIENPQQLQISKEFFLTEIIQSEESDLVHVCLGIFNGIYVDQIKKRITQLREMAESSEEKQQVKYINQLMEKSYWKAVGSNMGAMFEKFHKEGQKKPSFGEITL